MNLFEFILNLKEQKNQIKTRSGVAIDVARHLHMVMPVHVLWRCMCAYVRARVCMCVHVCVPVCIING